MAESIDERIADIEELDQLRQHTWILRQEAVEALTAEMYRPRPRHKGTPEWTVWEGAHSRKGWRDPGDDVEKAMMLQGLRFLTARQPGHKELQTEICKSIRSDLLGTKLVDCFKTKITDPSEASRDNVPVMRCAMVLQALIGSGQALSHAAFVCFYRIILELNEVVAPTWSSGTARASSNALASAFITGECARALIALETALLRTAEAAEVIGREQKRINEFRSELRIWFDQEEAFRLAALHVSLTDCVPYLVAELSDNVINLIKGLGEDIADPGTVLSSLVSQLDSELVAIIGKLPQVKDILNGAIPPSSTDEASPVAKIVGDAMGLAAKNAAQSILTQLIDNLKKDGPGVAGSARVAANLRDAARMVHELLEPIGRFADSIIDRELARPQLNLAVDAAELVFAGCILGRLSGWTQIKVRSAFHLAHKMLAGNGRLPSLQPFNLLGEGYRLNVATVEATRRLAELATHVGTKLEPGFVKTLMRPFEDTRAPGQDEVTRGWMTDPRGRDAKSEWWVTALVVDALGTVITMLDVEINRQVLEQFHVRRPADIDLDLSQLFYPDFGVTAVKKERAASSKNVAVKLQKLRLHAGRGPSEENPSYSLVLYGPPGTGKTTLVEAVAKSADVPLVEITPSDILVGGEEAIERRTRHVFLALSMLTNVVILFDEFDPILQDRAKRKSNELPKSIFEFLTPGMLPKLKQLHDSAKQNCVSYVLATNFVYNLDPAVIRQGRFDDRHGIYPPDPVSRLGRLLDQMKRQADPKLTLDDNAKIRQLNVVDKTRGGAMDQLGKPGWYSAKKFPRGFPTKSPFHYVESADRPLGDTRRETSFDEQWHEFLKQMSNSADSPSDIYKRMTDQERSYWDDWLTIHDWDNELGNKLTHSHTLASICNWLSQWPGQRILRDTGVSRLLEAACVSHHQ